MIAVSAAEAENRTKVPIRAIDPTDKRGVARLERGVAAFVEKVCGSYGGASTFEGIEIRACRQEAIAGIRRQLAAYTSLR